MDGALRGAELAAHAGAEMNTHQGHFPVVNPQAAKRRGTCGEPMELGALASPPQLPRRGVFPRRVRLIDPLHWIVRKRIARLRACLKALNQRGIPC